MGFHNDMEDMFADLWEGVADAERDLIARRVAEDPHYIPESGRALFNPPAWSGELAGVRELRNPIAGAPPGTWRDASRTALNVGHDRISGAQETRYARERGGGGPVVGKPAFNVQLEARRKLRQMLGRAGSQKELGRGPGTQLLGG